MGKYTSIGNLWNKVMRTALNKNFTDIDVDIQATKSEALANDAARKAEIDAMDARINNLIANNGNGTKDTELIDSRQSLDGTIHTTLRAHTDAIHTKVNVLEQSRVYVEYFKKEGAETDDTDRVQRAINAAPEYSEIVFDPHKTYSIKSVTCTKSLTINFQGASLLLNPYATQTPAFYFKGTVGASSLVSSDVNAKDRTLTVTGASTLFADEDFLIIGDNHVTPAWSGAATSYTGRYEINQISSISGDTITLTKPMEWAYTVADGFNVKKFTKLLKNPKIVNSGMINEVDPGAASTSSPANSGKGHLFQFQYCLGAELRDCYVDGYQMHVVNTNFCINTNIENISAVNPFRPSEGGHGYLVRDDNSVGTVVRKCYAVGARHVVDWSRSTDGVSIDNVSFDQSGVSFYTHGTGVKRCKSINDKVIGATSTEEGWSMGDPSFAADYDYEIHNCTYLGTGYAIGMKVGSDGLKVINPRILTRADYAIGVTRGAKNFTLIGGEIENYNTGVNRFNLLVDITTGSGTALEYPTNITVRGTKFKGNGIVRIDALGTVIFENNEFDVNITANGGLAGALRLCEVQAPSHMFIRGNVIKGAFDRGIYNSTAPSTEFVIDDNFIEGYRTTGIQVRSAGNLKLRRNSVNNNGSGNEIAFSGDVGASLTAGMVVKDNKPNKSRQEGTYTFDGNAGVTSYTIPHTLLGKPTRFNVISGNAVAGTAEIAYVTPWSTNLTISFKTAPPTGTGNVTVHWWAEI